MKLLVVNNLISGYGEGAIYDFIRSFVQDGDEVCLRSTDGKTRVDGLLYDAMSFDAVVASGGDGTVTAVCHVLANTDIPVLPFPAGTANLLTLNLALPNEPHALAKLLRAGITLDFDLATIEIENAGDPHTERVPHASHTEHAPHASHVPPVSHISPTPHVSRASRASHGFGIMAGAGYDAAIMAGAQPSKRLLGPAAYFSAAIANPLPPSSKITLELDGQTVESEGLGVLIVNFSKIQFDISMTEKNNPRDGFLDVVVLKAANAFGLIPALMMKLLERGSDVSGTADSLELHRARHVRVVATPPMNIQFDGEITNHTTPFSAYIMPKAARFLVSEECLELFGGEHEARLAPWAKPA